MMPFNEPELIKRVYDLNIPSISAIGHETDYTLLDLVCDLRAPTPTAAAELSVPNQIEVLKDLRNLQIDFSNNIKRKIVLPEKITALLKILYLKENTIVLLFLCALVFGCTDSKKPEIVKELLKKLKEIKKFTYLVTII